MKTILLIFLFPFFLKAQISDALHVYSGIAINCAVTAFTYKVTEKKTALAITTGLFAGCLGGYLKESLYDRDLHKGVYSVNDIILTSWGSVIGVNICIVGLHIHNQKNIDTLKYKNL